LSTASIDDAVDTSLKNGHTVDENDSEEAGGTEKPNGSSEDDAAVDEEAAAGALEAMLDDDEEESNDDTAAAALEQLMLDDDAEDDADAAGDTGDADAAGDADVAGDADDADTAGDADVADAVDLADAVDPADDDTAAVDVANADDGADDAVNDDGASNSEADNESSLFDDPVEEESGGNGGEDGGEDDAAEEDDHQDDGNEFDDDEEDDDESLGFVRSRRNTPAPSSMSNATVGATTAKYGAITDDKLDAMMQYVGDDVPAEVLVHFLEKSEGDIEAAVEDYFESDGQIQSDGGDGGFDDTEAEETLRMQTIQVTLRKRPIGIIMSVNKAGLPMVVRVLPGSAGATGGVQPEDQLVSMEGEAVEASASNYVVKTINGDGLALPATLEFIRQTNSDGQSIAADPVTTLKALINHTAGDDIPDDLAQYFLSEVGGDPDLAVKVYMEQKQGSPEKGNGGKQREMPRPAAVTALLNGSVAVSVSPTSSSHPSIADYEAILMGEALGMIVENMLENTVVVLVREGSAAEKASVLVGSMILSVNARSVVNMTHAETLECIKGSPRPLMLRLRPLNEEDLTQLREEMTRSRRDTNPQATKEEPPSSLNDVWPALYALLQVIEAIAPARHEKFCEAMLLEGWEHDDEHDRGDGSLDAILAQGEGGEGEQAGAAGGEVAASAGGGDSNMSFTRLAEMINSIQQRSEEEEELLELLATQLEPLIEVVTGVEYTEEEQPRDVFYLAQDPDSKKVGGSAEGGADDEDDEEAKDRKEKKHNGVLAVFQMLETLVRFPNERVRGLTTDGMAQLLRTWRSVKQAEFVNVALPFLRRLAASNTEHLRVTASRLFGCVYVRLSDDQRVQLRSIIDRFAKDECTAVRRSTAAALPEIGKLAGHDCVEWVMGLFTKLSIDDAEVGVHPHHTRTPHPYMHHSLICTTPISTSH
jgi:C-terminal processing protease CtpA/Prc